MYPRPATRIPPCRPSCAPPTASRCLRASARASQQSASTPRCRAATRASAPTSSTSSSRRSRRYGCGRAGARRGGRGSSPSHPSTALQDASNAAAAIKAHAEAKTAREREALAPAAAAASRARAENGMLWECAGLASGLLGQAAALHFTRHIPTLVAAYTWFSSAFALRFTVAVRTGSEGSHWRAVLADRLMRACVSPTLSIRRRCTR